MFEAETEAEANILARGHFGLEDLTSLVHLCRVGGKSV